MASVLLATLIAKAVGMPNISWAAISGYFVIRGRMTEILTRGSLRLVGTTVGALLAALLGPQILPGPMAVACVGAFVGLLSIYGALTAQRSQAWLLFGLMFGLTLFDKYEHTDHLLREIAAGRPLQAAVGIIAAIVVGYVSSLTARRYWPALVVPAPKAIDWSSEAAARALLGGLAILLLPWAYVAFAIPGPAQGYVTIITAMLFPLAGAPRRSKLIATRLIQRIAGSLAGGAVAGLLILIAHGMPTLLIGGMTLSVGVGRYVENRKSQIAHGGTQFILTVLVALAADSYEQANIEPAISRLCGIFFGMTLLAAVTFTWSAVLLPTLRAISLASFSSRS
ncbi:FUSC family protein [Dyella humicola]|uniref:FUSC family protein n=1 Tax=Dyella humicola TaxID=2992126 RepID=UPI0022518261|nr:FUSC family protein [Dyella humicola]